MRMNYYPHLLIMTVLSFISMYVLMYAMVDKFTDVYPNINQIYMAGLMTAPMAAIEILVMHAMYKNRAANIAILAVSIVALIGCFVLIRQQTAVGDVQFVKSMVPHHSGAILMCGKAQIADAELKELCASIIKGQQEEIDRMNAILKRLSAS